MHLTWLQNAELLYLQSRISSALTADFSPKIVRNFSLDVGDIENLATKYCSHLGRESFYELM